MSGDGGGGDSGASDGGSAAGGGSEAWRETEEAARQAEREREGEREAADSPAAFLRPNVSGKGAPRIGVIGGGQLARMMVPPAINLGLDLRILIDEGETSARFAASAVGDPRDLDAVLAFADTVDVVTFDHEHVPQNVLKELVDRGVAVYPAPESLLFAQDKVRMRAKLSELNIPIPEWEEVSRAEGLEKFIAEHDGLAVVKRPQVATTARACVSPRPVTTLTTGSTKSLHFSSKSGSVFAVSLTQLVARSRSGEVMAWPLVETAQTNGVCVEVVAPAPGSPGRLADVACDIACTLAEELGVVGVFAVELFETDDDRVLVNELAMRPHNTGHWTIDGSTTSQFEQHLRAVAGLPLGATGSHARWAVMVNIFGNSRETHLPEHYVRALAKHPTVKVHNYGKNPRLGRKLGHVTAIGDGLDEALYEARGTAAFFHD